VSDWHTLDAPAKLNLALVVGPSRADGKHDVATVLERLTLADSVSVRRAEATRVEGFEDDTLVRAALDEISRRADESVRLEARIDKRIPVAAGLGGGSSDAATALRLANGLLDVPLPADELDSIAASLGADVPFFLREGPQLGTGDGTSLAQIELPRDYTVLLVLPNGVSKSSTAEVYAAFDSRGGGAGFEERRAHLLRALADLDAPTDLGGLPSNDLVSSPLAGELLGLGAFRADATGAGPVAYGLFASHDVAKRARAELDTGVAATWIAEPA
jgi:4-diphosphocytidyl-2-C-methyl-D-erythritol kinase